MVFERITIDHEKMGGLPCIRGLRIPVSDEVPSRLQPSAVSGLVSR
ncbi:MAG: DUF433 domain-containing protein [Pseudonocardiaceae bacterium]